LSAEVPLGGEVSASSALSGDLKVSAAVDTQITAESSMQGTLSASVPLGGSIAAVSTLTARARYVWNPELGWAGKVSVPRGGGVGGIVVRVDGTGGKIFAWKRAV
jgi:hypothetical protein